MPLAASQRLQQLAGLWVHPLAPVTCRTCHLSCQLSKIRSCRSNAAATVINDDACKHAAREQCSTPEYIWADWSLEHNWGLAACMKAHLPSLVPSWQLIWRLLLRKFQIGKKLFCRTSHDVLSAGLSFNTILGQETATLVRWGGGKAGYESYMPLGNLLPATVQRNLYAKMQVAIGAWLSCELM